MSVQLKVNIKEKRQLVTRLIAVGYKYNDHISTALKAYEITIQQFNVLRILRGRKGTPASLKEVSKDMLHASSNVTRVIDKLIKKELVTRKQCPENRRKIEILITNTGLELLKDLDKSVEEAESELTAQLTSSEITEILKQLTKI